ncbi:MAG: hypothetical protein ACLQGP_13670 [Isosphaeraceae bacterium]
MKRLKKILKWTWNVAGAAIGILLILNAYFVWSTGTRLERRLSELRQAGDPVQIADLARPAIPPETNADVFLRRAADDLDAIQKELAAMYPRMGYPTGEVAPGHQEKLESLFAAYPRVMPLLEQAADCPDSDPQLDYNLPPSRFSEISMQSSGRNRTLSRVLRARSAWLLSKGRIEDALATQVLMLRLTRQMRRDPFIIGYLVRLACEQVAMDGVNQALQAGPVPPAARQALDNELALHDTMEGYKWAMRTERAYSLTSFREMPGAGLWLTRAYVNDVMSRVIDLFDRYLKEAAQPHADVVARKGASPPPNGGANPYGALVTLLIPSLDGVRPAAERTRAMSRSLRVLNAIQARVPPGTDRAPGLGDLGIPPEVTIDPFSGEPMHVKWMPEGWMVYSVGKDLVDDGGLLDRANTDVGVGPILQGETQKKP